MQGFISLIRKIVVMVLLLELLMQLQPGKHYETYIKVFVGLFIVCTIVRGITGANSQGGFEINWPIYEYEMKIEDLEDKEDKTETIRIPINRIEIEKIEIERIENLP